MAQQDGSGTAARRGSSRVRLVRHPPDAAPSQELADVVLLAAQACRARIAFVHLVRGGEDAVPAAVGLDPAAWPGTGLCAAALAKGDLLVVKDAAASRRFRDDPLVRAAPGVRFYAGVPVPAPDGSFLGTLAVADAGARALSSSEAEALRALARHAAAHLSGAGRGGVMEDDAGTRPAREGDGRFRLLLDSLPLQVWTADADGRIRVVNQKAASYFGVSSESLAGQVWWPRVHEDDRARFEEAWVRALRAGEPVELEARLVDSRGSARWHLARAVPQVDPSSGGREWVGMCIDIEERRRAEHRQRESEHRYAQILDSVRDMVFCKSPGSVVTYANKATCDYYGMTAEELRGVTDVKHNPREHTEGYLKDDQEVFATGRAVETREERNQRASGEVRWFHTIKTPIFDTAGNVVELVGVARDVTDRKRIEEDVRLQKAVLEAQAEAILDGVVVTGLDGRILLANRRFEEVWGLEPGTLSALHGEAVLALVLERVADPAAFAAQVEEVRASPSAVVRDEVPLKDGRVLERYGAPVVTPDGTQQGRVWTFRDITDRKRGEQATSKLLLEIEEQRRRLDAIVASVPGVVWEAWGEPDAAQQRIDFVSEHVERMLGYTTKEWLATPNFWLTIVHPDDKERAAQQSRERFLTGKGGTQQFRWRRKDGSYVWVQAWNTVIHDTQGRPVGMRGVTMDITERKRAEETLARLAAIVQDSDDAIYGKSLDGKITDWNPGAERLYGYAKDEIVGSPILRLVPEDRVEEERGILARIAKGERVPPFETERRRKDGTLLHVSLTVSPIRDSGGRIVGASAIARDVSERKRTERAMARLAAIVQDSEDAIYLKSLDGRIAEWNPGAERLYGWKREEVLGRSSRTLVPEARVEEERDILARIAKGERVPPFETERRRKDGTVFPVSLSLSPVRGAGGVVLAASAVARDISARKRVEDELRRRAEELARLTDALQRSNRELDQFAYITSHDLKAPLRGIANLSRWIEEDLQEHITGESRQHLDLLRGRVHRMEALIDAILEYSRVGRVRARPERVDVAEMLRETIDLLSPPEGFRVEVEGAMPTLHTERMRLQQVFMNLVSNAVKHHHRKDGRVRIGVEDAGDMWRFSVSDDGPGISARFHEKVFVIFQTLEARDKVEGTGIGLALVKKIVESQGGSVTLESDEGKGATFRFTWPKSG